MNGKAFPDLEILTVKHTYLTTNIARLTANLKTGCLKKLNLKGCSIANRKQFAEDMHGQTSIEQLSAGYVDFALKRDNYGMIKDGLLK